jgi:hypothetical protein
MRLSKAIPKKKRIHKLIENKSKKKQVTFYLEVDTYNKFKNECGEHKYSEVIQAMIEEFIR